MSITNELEERLIALETRYAFQENTIDQLNGEIMRQQGQIDDLIRRLKDITQQINPGVGEKESEKPPHY
jgi:SlyX protein